MLAIIKKEFNSFFSSAIGYLVIAIFLLINGLFLWVFKGQFNIFDSGFADLLPFFQLAPWLLLFLIPAITMRSIAEERKQGTLELLVTKPLTKTKLVLGKYFGSLVLILMALLPSLLYVLTIAQLGDPVANFDVGSTLGSYISLFLLCGAFTAMGIFASSCSANQIVAFLSATFLCFLFYFGFSGLSNFSVFGSADYYIQQIGMQVHYEKINQGVLDSRAIFYFIGFTVFFIAISVTLLQQLPLKKTLRRIGVNLIALLVFNGIISYSYFRIDLTEDQRFTLSEATTTLVKDVHGTIAIDVLLKGDFPAEFRKLQYETQQLLEEFNALNPKIQFVFTNPIEEEEFRSETIAELQRFGLTPMEVTVKESGKTEIETVVPWAIMNYQNQSVKIPLIKNTIGATTEERVTNSIQQLEFTFADALKKLLQPRKHKIAVLKGNGQLPDIKIADFIKTLQDYYLLGAFTLDSVATNPEKTVADLKKYDLIINAKPTEAFSEKEKFVLDQFIMNGGKSLWLVESVAMDIDSLLNPEGVNVAVYRDLNLDDQLFSYGVRVNPVLINDLQSTPLVLASGQGNNTQFTPYRWFYTPLARSYGEHPIVKNIESVKFDFANQIDTLPNSIDKTILLTSSDQTRLEGVPRPLNIEMIREKPDFGTYTAGPQPLAVLLEGNFTSAYANRIKPLTTVDFTTTSAPTKMVVVADGDVIKNTVRRGQPLPLGLDPYLNLTYGNKEFLLNTVNYLLDDTGLIEVRGKDVQIPFLNVEKVVAQRTSWQFINTLVPILVLIGFGVLFTWIRRKRYQR
ncbi:gliding motility-associated ABC transporter substrate-binding protein GldG [Aquimarina brevivitae]|uniref:ABC-2 type transport system permease protein n=1 Tax=Aquimarina brevivitae TaxID=323412 RepID=A0A4Q7NUH1_9FLAO|nr:gliding motility-associated ABC transporter substrate-binding protein GldG [Aquimarina brevivitae]RZS90580.1 ABC-2 type transport system permease protein [Aquimarina brevivitae]